MRNKASQPQKGWVHGGQRGLAAKTEPKKKVISTQTDPRLPTPPSMCVLAAGAALAAAPPASGSSSPASSPPAAALAAGAEAGQRRAQLG